MVSVQYVFYKNLLEFCNILQAVCTNKITITGQTQLLNDIGKCCGPTAQKLILIQDMLVYGSRVGPIEHCIYMYVQFCHMMGHHMVEKSPDDQNT